MANIENETGGPPPKSELTCAACGNHLEVGARFCWECGATVDTPRLAPQARARPDVVFVDELDAETEPTTRVEPATRTSPATASDPLSALSWVPPVAAGFAIFALLIALLVHAFAPDAVAGYSAAELDLKVQMRAVEWLLAGILVTLVGLLVKR